MAASILEHERDAARGPYPWDVRWGEDDGLGIGDRAQRAGDMSRNSGQLLFRPAPLVPRFERDEIESVCCRIRGTEQAEACNSGGILNAGCRRENGVDLSHDLVGALQGSRIRQLHIEKGIALVLVRQKAPWQTRPEQH